MQIKPTRIIWLFISASMLIGAGKLWYEGKNTNSWIKSVASFNSDYVYSYTVNGKNYNGSRFVYGDIFDSYQFIKTYEFKSLHEDPYVYVDPMDPNYAVVVRGPYWELIIFLTVVGLLIMIITVFWRHILEVIINQSYLPTRKDWGGG